jgi:membrane protease YdiL (CAAX protease family)
MLPLSTQPQDQKLALETNVSRRRWSVAGLAIALFAMPLVVGLFTALRIPWTAQNIVIRELTILASAGALVFIIRRKELLGWESVGLQRASAGKTALWVLITIPCVALALVLAFGVIHLFRLPVGSADASKFDQLPVWILVLVIMRAGFVEEFFYRGYAIDRMQRLMGSRVGSISVPLLLFGAFHYRQGWAGIIIAFLTGAVLTVVYLYKRNLWIGITTHFLVDFIPNVVLPLFAAKGN